MTLFNIFGISLSHCWLGALLVTSQLVRMRVGRAASYRRRSLYLNPYRVGRVVWADVFCSWSSGYPWRIVSRGISPSSWAISASSTQSSLTFARGSTRKCARWRTRWPGLDRSWWIGRATSSRLRPGKRSCLNCNGLPRVAGSDTKLLY